jgi:outer membrane receptor protein involved in Fe transport
MQFSRPLLLCCGLGLYAAAYAQKPLEEIVVTAGLRKTDAMTSPGSVTVVDTAEIEERAAKHLESVLAAAPNVSYSAGASRARFIQMRGIGDLEQFVDPKHFPAVGITIDGIDVGGTANAAMLFDTQQVEILRGPQGTAFGTGALAGLVNIRGRRAGDTFESELDAGAGDYGSWNLGGIVSGPMSDTVKGRLAMELNRGDGYIHNAYLDRNDTNGYHENFMRASLDVDPRPAAHYALTALYFNDDNGYDAFSLDNNRVTQSDQPGKDRQQSVALAGRGEWDLGPNKRLESITTWSNTHRLYSYDEDWTYVGFCKGILCDPVADYFSSVDAYHRARDQVSQDVRLIGDLASLHKLEATYVVGAYAEHRSEELHRRHTDDADFFSSYGTDRRAVYGQLKTDFTPAISLTAGFRYERFTDAYSDSYDFASASGDDLRTGELTLGYRLGADSLFYATLSRGAKAGAVNTDASASFPLMQPKFQAFMQGRLRARKETLLNREIGIKGTYRGGRLDFRAALFDMSRRDAQLESWIWDAVNYLWIGFLDNADGRNWGLETELNYRLSDRVRLFGSFGRLRTNVDRITSFDLDKNAFVTRENIDQARAPAWQYDVGAQLSLTPKVDLHLEVNGSADSRFGYYHDKRLPSYRLVNASLNLHTRSAEWSLWGRNLTDEMYAVYGLYFGNDPRIAWANRAYYQYGEPRVFGVSVRYAF